ncbi:MAG TPA: hypothetical protein VFR07_03330 [Mycobacteriales bacterium]|nr:hypothetical protein [Mycobacteriales bacterium]
MSRTSRTTVPATVLGAALLMAAGAQASAAQAAGTPATAWANAGAGVHRSSPTLGALSVGRVVLQADMAGQLTATRGDGSVAWRSAVDPQPGARTAVQSTPAVGDLTGDGSREVVVGAGAGGQFTNQHGGVVAYRGDGSVLWRWRSPDRFGPQGRPDGWGDGIYSSPAIGDVSGDGRADVVFGGWDHQVWGLDGATGNVLGGFPFENADTVWSSPALSDTDGDGVLDLVIGGDASACGCAPGSYDGGVLRVLTAVDGKVTQRFRVNVPDIVASSPAIGDLEGNGRQSAVFVVGNYWRPADSRRVWAVHLDDGSPVPGWPQRTDAPGFGSVALGDVAPGGGLEVVVGDTEGTMYAWHGNGALAWRTHPGDTTATIFGGPSIGDLNGDGDQDVAIGYAFGGALLLDGATGTKTAQVYAGPYASESTPLFADFGGAAGRRLVVAGFNAGVADFASGQLAAFRLPSTTAADAWPMFRKEATHRGGGTLPSGVRGAIGEHWRALGGADGVLGMPTSGELRTPYRDGRYTTFQRGAIYWTAGTGAHEVHGAVRDRWGALGWENGLLGFPTSDRIALAGGSFGRFEGGQIYQSPATGAHEVHGLIFQAWGRTGYEAGPLGYPRTDERPLSGRAGASNLFTGGAVFWSAGTGAHAVVGALRDAYRGSGWEKGCLGLPVADEQRSTPGGVVTCTSAFENGTITWTAAGGARVSCR